jgi:hypothetical protein
MKAMTRFVLSLALMLAACGSGGAGGKSKDWADDACKTFPVEAAAKVAGVAVSKTVVSGTSAGDTKVSNCTYSTADGKANFGIVLRHDTSGQTTAAEQIAGLTSQPDVTGPSEEVPMPKGKAVWAPKLNTLSYVPEDNRMIVVTPPGAIVIGGAKAPEADLKAKAVAIATAIEG